MAVDCREGYGEEAAGVKRMEGNKEEEGVGAEGVVPKDLNIKCKTLSNTTFRSLFRRTTRQEVHDGDEGAHGSRRYVQWNHHQC